MRYQNFRLVTNQFDVSQGRSEGEQVNIITRSGTNDLHGTAYGNFRRDEFNASDFVSHGTAVRANYFWWNNWRANHQR